MLKLADLNNELTSIGLPSARDLIGRKYFFSLDGEGQHIFPDRIWAGTIVSVLYDSESGGVELISSALSMEMDSWSLSRICDMGEEGWKVEFLEPIAGSIETKSHWFKGEFGLID